MSAEAPESFLDPLIGRAGEIKALESALTDHRLVTITGLGGAGKTRLAREVLGRARTRGMPGWFVDLGHLTDAAAVPGAIAAVLGVADTAEVEISSAIAHKTARSGSLLVLDNLEQVIAARRSIEDLLGQAAQLRILTTSRVPLGLRGERVFQLDPLPVPGSVDELERSDASRLFVARSLEHGRLRSMSEDERQAVVEICRRLDGLPLALELGAAWTRLLSPVAILRRLEESRLTLASGGDGRHASLQAVVDSTLDLVRPEDRAVFESLAVFAGGFEEPAATAVTRSPDVLSSLRRLEEVALVRVVGEHDGEPRFSMLETIRTVAAQALLGHGNHDEVCGRHAIYFAAWAETQAEVFRRSGDPISRATFQAEIPNLRVAQAFAVASDDALVALRLATAMGVVGRRSPGSLREHIDLLDRALRMGPVAPHARCEGLNAYAWLADDVLGDSPDADATTGEALELAESLASPLLLARTLIARATIAVPADAEELLERAAMIATDHGLPFEAASAFNNAADVLGRRGQFDEARALCSRALAVSTESGDLFGHSLALLNAGEIDANLGRLGDAVKCLEGAVEGHAIASSGPHLARSLSLLAAAEALSGRRGEAYRHLDESAGMIDAMDATTAIVNFLGDAVTVLMPGHRITAVHALGAVRSAERTSATLMGQPLLTAAEASARGSLEQAKFDRAYQTGAALTPRIAFDEVRALLESSAHVGRRGREVRLRGAFGELTVREAEVLALLAEARSDIEIADALSISPKTSSVHVANIKSKLGVETRVEAALRARELLASGPRSGAPQRASARPEAGRHARPS